MVRLIALAPTDNPSRFRVLSVDAKMDDAVRAPENKLTVDSRNGPFSYVLFQCNTEQEGIDDLTFVPAKIDDPKDGYKPRPKTPEARGRGPGQDAEESRP